VAATASRSRWRRFNRHSSQRKSFFARKTKCRHETHETFETHEEEYGVSFSCLS
jgi:hypothetical protein